MMQVLNVLHALLSARLSTSVFCFFPSAVSYALSSQPQVRSFTRCGSALLPAVGPLCVFFVVTVNHPSRRCSLWTAVIFSPLLRAATVHHVLRHVLTVLHEPLVLLRRRILQSPSSQRLCIVMLGFVKVLRCLGELFRCPRADPRIFPPHAAPLRAVRGPLVVTPASTAPLPRRSARGGL